MVRNRIVTKINLNNILLGLLSTFTDALRNFLRFTVADSDFAFSKAERVESRRSASANEASRTPPNEFPAAAEDPVEGDGAVTPDEAPEKSS